MGPKSGLTLQRAWICLRPTSKVIEHLAEVVSRSFHLASLSTEQWVPTTPCAPNHVRSKRVAANSFRQQCNCSKEMNPTKVPNILDPQPPHSPLSETRKCLAIDAADLAQHLAIVAAQLAPEAMVADTVAVWRLIASLVDAPWRFIEGFLEAPWRLEVD